MASAPTISDLGNVIKNSRIRGIIYAGYVLAILAVGAYTAYMDAVDMELPSYVDGINAVLLYVGVPVGSLALANRTTTVTYEVPAKE